MFLLKCVSCFKSYLTQSCWIWDGWRTQVLFWTPKNIPNIRICWVLTPLSTYLLSWKNPNSIMFAMKSGMYYKVKKPKLIYWKSNMFRFNQTLIWTNILLCASMAQPTIPNGQKVLFRNWSMNGGQPLFSFDYNCTLTTRVEVTENLPFIFSVMGQLISLCLTFQSTRWSKGA